MPVYEDEKLKDLEEKSSAGALEKEHGSDFSNAEKSELDQLSDKVGSAGSEKQDSPSLYKPDAPKKGLRGRVNAAKKAKLMWIGGGIAATLIGVIFTLFSFLLPFKAFHITQMIEDKVGSVPEYAVDRRMEYYLNRFLILKTLENSGIDTGKDSPYTYLGAGVFSTLYTNWSGAKLDKTIQQKYNFRLVPEKNNDPKILGRRASARPSGWRIEYLDQKDRLTGHTRSESLTRSEARQFIRDIAKNETRSHQVFKRYHMRKVIKRYNGVDNWRPFEQTRDETRDKYYAKKLAFKRYMVNQTAGKVSARYAAYLTCLLEGADKCRDQLNRGAPPSVDPEATGAIDETPEGEGGGDKNFLVKKLQDLGVKKVLSSAAFGIGILDTFSQINRAIESGTLSYIVYDNVSKQYAGYSSGIRSASDQVRSGDGFDVEDARVLSETFDDFEQSPVYQAGFANSKSGSVSAAGERISRDCNGDGDTTDEGELLKAGELVCPNKKALQDKEGIKDIPGYGAFSQLIAAYDSTIGHVVGWVTSAASALISATHADDAIAKLAELSGVKDLLGGAFKSFMGYIVGFAITGAEEGPDAFDATLAGILAADSQMGGAMGGPRDATVGGQYLTQDQVGQIQTEQQQDLQYAASRQDFFHRYFSPENTDSLTSFAIIHTPSSASSGMASFLSFINPIRIFGSISGNVTDRSSAFPKSTSTNPFGILQFGYSANSEVFTANDGDGLESNELYTKYGCSLPVDERPQNKAYGRPDGLPFDVPVQTDPCLLEQAVLDAGIRYLNNTYDESTGTNSSLAVPNGTIDVANLGATSISIPCAAGTKDIGTVQTNYTGELAKAGAPKIRLCQLSSIPGQGNNSTGVEINGGAVVNSRVAAAWQALGAKAKTAGVNLVANSSFRLADSCSGTGDGSNCAKPGTSMHQLGIAIDFADMQVKGTSTKDCSARATVYPSLAWSWLYSNAEQFGIKQYTYEAWHWDPAPLANRCGAGS